MKSLFSVAVVTMSLFVFTEVASAIALLIPTIQKVAETERPVKASYQGLDTEAYVTTYDDGTLSLVISDPDPTTGLIHYFDCEELEYFEDEDGEFAIAFGTCFELTGDGRIQYETPFTGVWRLNPRNSNELLFSVETDGTNTEENTIKRVTVKLYVEEME